MENERRSAPRYPFIAHGEVLDEGSEARLKTRISDISRTGCYLDMVNPLPSGTPIQVTIFGEGGTVRAKGRIVYAVEHMGAGVAFEMVEAAALPVLQGWLAAAQQTAV